MPYDWSAALPGVAWSRELPGIFSRHDDSCPVQYGVRCTCGPLGYFATVVDPVTNSAARQPSVCGRRGRAAVAARAGGRPDRLRQQKAGTARGPGGGHHGIPQRDAGP